MTLRYINHFNHLLDDLEQHSLKRTLKICDSASAPIMTIDGQAMLTFCSNDYLGLANHPELAKAISEGLQLFGSGSGASHMISGHHRPHDDLEKALAKTQASFIPEVRALFFSTGYMANLAVLSALAGKDAEIFSEELNHASLIDGARLARSTLHIYPHRDLAKLEALLQHATAKDRIVVTDSVFSMDGDIAPLRELLALCERYGAWLVVDDAHGFGVLGERGRGVLELLAVSSPQLVYIGTLGKAAGVAGAFVAAHPTVVEWLVQRARPYIYTTAAPPAVAHALLTSIDIIDSDEGRQRRMHLALLIARLRERLTFTTWSLLPSQTPIQPVIIGDNARTMAAGAALLARGFWVGAIRPPTVPVGSSRLRITLSAAHTLAQVDALADALLEIESAQMNQEDA